MGLCHIALLGLLFCSGVLCRPQGDDTTSPEKPTSDTVPSTPRPKREASESHVSDGHVAKRDASCCGAESPKACCGANAEASCCGTEKLGLTQEADEEVERLSRDLKEYINDFGNKSWFITKSVELGIKDCASDPKACLHIKKRESLKTKRGVEVAGNDSSCCGKDRLVRDASPATNSSMPTDQASPSTSVAIPPVLTPARFVREDNKSCCGVETSKSEEKPKRGTQHEKRCCGLTSAQSKDNTKSRLARETCCGSSTVEDQQGGGASTSAPKSKRCNEATTNAAR